MEFEKTSFNTTIKEADIIRKFDRHLAKHGKSDDNITIKDVVDFAEDCVIESPIVDKLLRIHIGFITRNYNVKK